MKISKSRLEDLIKEQFLNKAEDRGQEWSKCKDSLCEIASTNGLGYVCHLCASHALEHCGMGPATMHMCCDLIQDCIRDGRLKSGYCPEYREVTVYYLV